MISTAFRAGAPGWIDLGTPDIDTTARFYGSVFGWEFRSFGPEMGNYGFLLKDGKVIGGLGPLTEEGARSAWMIYFDTADVEATTHAVERSGGTVRMPPTEPAEEGRMAQFTDPQGGQSAAWQPGTMPSMELVNAPGSLLWTELYTTDADAAKRFYGSVFGWETTDTSMPGGEGTYSMISPAGGGEELMQGGLFQLDGRDLPQSGGRAYWHPVFHVEDCDTTVAAVRDNGGTVEMGPEDAEGVGRIAVCTDPAGAEFVLLTPSPL